MHIGIDIRCLSEEHASGIGEYTYNLVKHLLQIDQQNQYFLFYNANRRPLKYTFSGNNVEVKQFKFPNKLFNLSQRFLRWPNLDRLLGGVDLFIMPNFLFLSLSNQCKKIIIVHDLSFELYPEFFTLKNRLWHKLIQPKKLCQQADKIIAISENTKQDLVELYDLSAKKIACINPGINDLFFAPINQADLIAVEQKYKLPEKFILYLGNLEPRKNIPALIRAFEKISDPDVALVLAGSRAWKYEAIDSAWRQSQKRSLIKFLGYVEQKDKPALYKLAKLFVYPSIYEGFGLPPLEAMACGTPTIGSFASSLPEAVGDGGVLVDPNNISELAGIIDQVLSQSELAQSLSVRGQARARNFSWQNKAQEFLRQINAEL